MVPPAASKPNGGCDSDGESYKYTHCQSLNLLCNENASRLRQLHVSTNKSERLHLGGQRGISVFAVQERASHAAENCEILPDANVQKRVPAILSDSYLV